MRGISRRAIRRARVLPELCLVPGRGHWELGIVGFVDGRERALVGKLGDVRGGAGVVFQFRNEIGMLWIGESRLHFIFMLTIQNMRRIPNPRHDDRVS
jgi:hypothetical protein